MNLSFRKISRRFKKHKNRYVELSTPRISQESNSKPENPNFREKNHAKLDLKDYYEINLWKDILADLSKELEEKWNALRGATDERSKKLDHNMALQR